MADADTLGEFLKSFSDGYFELRLNGASYPARVARERDPPSGFLGVTYTANKQGSTLSRDINWLTERDMIVREYPDLGCLKVGQTVGYLKTRPLRQYKKGYVPANAELFMPNYTQIRRVLPRFVASSNSKEVIWQIFNRDVWHPMEAIRLMDAGEGVGYPIGTKDVQSPNFGLYCTDHAENVLIMYKNRDVGVYKDGSFELFKPFGELKQQFERETNVECRVCRQ